MPSVKKTLQMTGLLFGMTILFCYIGWHLGYEGFILVGDIELPFWLQNVISFVLLLVNLSLQGGFTLKEYSWKILKYSLPLTTITAIGVLVFNLPGEIFSGFMPLIVFFVFSILRDRKLWWRSWFVNAVILVHQWAVSNFTQTPLTYEVSVYTILRLSIDAILLLLLFYSIGGARHHALEQLVFPGRRRAQRSRHGSGQADTQSTDDVPVGKFEKWVMRSVIAVVQVIQWMFILWVCSLDNLFLDALVMTTSFICHGMIIKQRQHLKPIILCTLAATAMFYFAARFTISFQYSQFFPIVIGLALVYTVYRISYQIESKAIKEAEESLERVKALETKIDQVWDRLDEII